MTSQKCAYKAPSGKSCHEEVYEANPYCILHIELPDDMADPNYHEIEREKDAKVQEKVQKGDFNFEGARLSSVDFDWKTDIKHLNFNDARIYGDASFNDAILLGDVWFSGAIIRGNIWFERAEIKGDAVFDHAIIDGGRFACFSTEILGKLSFEYAEIKHVEAQEEAYRKAKQVWEKLGDRTRSDDYFYREMGAKRKQKKWYVRYPECVVQYGFWYGVYPSRVLGNYVLVFAFFACLFWVTHGIYTYSTLTDSAGFSFLNILIPGYDVITEATAHYGVAAIAETAIGAFMWPVFIVTFARKYMR